MREDIHQFQNRQRQRERQESASRERQLIKANSYAAGQWKSYAPRENSQSSGKRSIKTPSYYTNRALQANYNGTGEQDNRIRSILISRKEQEQRRQQSTMRKVKELQEKVLPMVRGHHNEEERVWIGWQSRIDQKLIRLQGQVDNMKRQMQLQMEKRIVELQGKWQLKFNQFLNSSSDKF